jgi:hypothetical protein
MEKGRYMGERKEKKYIYIYADTKMGKTEEKTRGKRQTWVVACG